MLLFRLPDVAVVVEDVHAQAEEARHVVLGRRNPHEEHAAGIRGDGQPVRHFRHVAVGVEELDHPREGLAGRGEQRGDQDGVGLSVVAVPGEEDPVGVDGGVERDLL